MNKYITSKHFYKLMTHQPYFVWNQMKKEETDIESMSGSMFSDFWTEDILEDETSYGEIINKTSFLIEKKLVEEFKNEGAILNTKKSIEDKIEFTKENNKGVIVYPVFEYKDAISRPIAFDFKTKTIHYIKFSSKSKLKDMIDVYWDVEILKKNGIKVKEVYIHFPRKKDDYKKGEIDLDRTNMFVPTKTGGDVYTAKKVQYITTFINKPNSFISNLTSIDSIIEDIEDAKDIDEPSLDLVYKDSSSVGNNPSKNELLENLGFKYSGYNGFVLKHQDIVDFIANGQKETVGIRDNDMLQEILNLKKAKIYDSEPKEIEQIKNADKVVWYDFEGFSLPISPMDYIKPYQQVVFQVSKILTINNIEEECENIVIDPLTINNDDFVTIINSVYSNKADKYVVYNKGYEIPRMKEMVKVLMLSEDERWREMQEKVNHIEVNTVDLMNLFAIRSKKPVFPPIILHDQKGRFSIKNVEKHISSNHIKLPRPIKEYKTLEVKNGTMAMQLGIERSLNLIGDSVWNGKIEYLKEYCENDVRAMIMVYDFAIHLINKK